MPGIGTVTGIVLRHRPIGETDYAVTLLTRELGKVSAFARGARKMGGRLSGTMEPFCFGEFELYEGRAVYSISEARISNYFEGFRQDLDASLYGTYFLELADITACEGNPDEELLKLLYQSLRALFVPSLDRRLVRSIYELRLVAVEGEFPGMPRDRRYREATEYAVRYCVETPIEKLYTFAVTEEVLEELAYISTQCRRRFIDRPVKSLELLNSIGNGP